jgi:hypothetical protein
MYLLLWVGRLLSVWLSCWASVGALGVDLGASKDMNVNRRVGLALVGTKDKPLQANYEEIYRDIASPEQPVISHKKGKMYRDSEGRERWDEVADDVSQTTETAIFYDPVQKICVFYATEFLCGEMPPVRTVGFPLSVTGSWRSISEERRVEGFLCRGYIANLPQGAIVEYWYSEELANCLLWKERSKDEERSFRLFNLLVGEPDSRYFIQPKPPSKSDM